MNSDGMLQQLILVNNRILDQAVGSYRQLLDVGLREIASVVGTVDLQDCIIPPEKTCT